MKMTETQQTAITHYVTSGDVQYAYRRFGNTSKTHVPLLFLMHFRGTMDYWDPLLINSVAAQRPVILFDNAGVGKTTGDVADSMKGMAIHAIRLLQALHVEEVDVLGFSMGGYVATMVYLEAPVGLVRKLIITGSGCSAGAGIEDNSPERAKRVAELAAGPNIAYDNGFEQLFYYPSATSQAAGREWYKRIFERGPATSGEERSNLVSHKYADEGKGVKTMLAAFAKFKDLNQRADGSYDRLGGISIPTFIAQGKDDLMIPTHNSYVLQQKIPNARLKMFPDSGHGFLFQFAEEFAEDVNRFLDSEN